MISLARMRRVLEVNPEDLYARVQAGVVNVDLSGACAEHGLFYAPDPSSQMACTHRRQRGGELGRAALLQVRRHHAPHPGPDAGGHDGAVLDLSSPEVDPDGYDLVGLFVGSEGTFGLATEVTVRLTRRPEVVEVLLGVFGDLDAACDAVSDIIAAKLSPRALEILDR